MNLRLPILAVGAFAIGTDTFVVAGVLPEVARSLDTTIADAGWISTLFALTYAVGAPVLGALTGRVERRTLLVCSLIGFALGNAASAVAPTLGLLLAARVATAAAAALYVPAASAAAAAISPPERRARSMAVVLGGISLATLAGVPFGTWLAADVSWRATFAAVAGLGAVCAAAIAVGLPRLALPAAPSLAARLAPARDRRVLATVLTTMLFLTGGYIALTYVGELMAPATGGDGTTLAFLLLVFGVTAVIGTSAGGRATDRFGATPVLVAAVAVLGLVLVTLPLTRAHLVTAALALALWGLAGMASQPPQQHRLFTLAPQTGPLLISLNSSATFAGIALGGAIGNLILGSGGGADALGLVGAGFVAVSLLTAALGARRPAARLAPAG